MNPTSYRGTLWILAGEILAVVLLSTWAATGPGAARTALMLMVVLWLILLMNDHQQIAQGLTNLGLGTNFDGKPGATNQSTNVASTTSSVARHGLQVAG